MWSKVPHISTSALWQRSPQRTRRNGLCRSLGRSKLISGSDHRPLVINITYFGWWQKWHSCLRQIAHRVSGITGISGNSSAAAKPHCCLNWSPAELRWRRIIKTNRFMTKSICKITWQKLADVQCGYTRRATQLKPQSDLTCSWGF